MFEQAFLGRVPIRGVSSHLAGPSLGEEMWPPGHPFNVRDRLERFERAQREGATDEELGWLWESYLESLSKQNDWARNKIYGKQPVPSPTPTPTPTPTQSRMPTNVPQYSWNNQARNQNQDVASVQCPAGQRWDGTQCVWIRQSTRTLPTVPFGGVFGQSAAAAPLTATTATSYGNYAGT